MFLAVNKTNAEHKCISIVYTDTFWDKVELGGSHRRRRKLLLEVIGLQVISP